MDIIELNKKAWNEIGSRAAPEEIKDDQFRKMFELFCKKLPKKAKVLDIGCGPGRLIKELSKRGFEVTGIDFSEKMLELARKKVPDAKYMEISMTDIEFQNEFDGMISSFSMLCLDPENFKKTARKISNGLKKNGLFLLFLNEPHPKKEHDEKENYTEIMGQKIYSRPYTEDEIRNIFNKCDMEILTAKRETITSDEYGEEYTLLLLMQKK